MSKGLRAYIYTVAMIGVMITLWSVAQLALGGANAPGLLIFMAVVVLVEFTGVDLMPGSRASISVSSAVYFASMLVFGPYGGTVVAVSSGLAATAMSIRGQGSDGQSKASIFRRAAFNLGAFAIAALSGGLVYVWTGGTIGALDGMHVVAPVLLGALVMDVVNASLIAGVVSIQTNKPAYGVWRDNFMWAAPINILTMSIGGGALALGYLRLDWVGLSAFLLPVLATSYAFRLYVERTKEQMANLEHIIAERTAELKSANEELRRADQQKTQFYSIINHEMRTPLTSILGYCDLLRVSATLEAKPLGFVETIKDNGQRLLGLVNNLLDISRLEAGRMTLMRDEVALANAANQALRVIQPLAEQKHIRIRMDVPETLPPVFADEKKLSQVLINLMSNAVKYTPDTGSITVSARALYDNDMVQCDVVDTGIGIPASKLPTIFDRFSRVDSEQTKDTVGTGLGLTITKGLVEGHGGEIWVESEEGVGSTFSFTVPVYAGQPPDVDN